MARRSSSRSARTPPSRWAANPWHNLGELALKLTERLEARPEGARVVHVRGDESLPYADVWKVLEICRQAGAEEVALLARQGAAG